MNSIEGNNFENKLEQEPKLISKVYFIRHGATDYKEYQVDSQKDITNDLSEKGEEEIKLVAETIIKDIDKNIPVRIMSSPRIRTKHSAYILQEELTEKGIKLDPSNFTETESFEGVRTKGDAAEIWTELGEKYGAELDKLWRMNELSEPDKAESSTELFERIKNSFEQGIRIIRKNEQSGHRDLSQIVLVSHGEIIEGLIAAYGFRPFYDPERKFKTGGVGEIKIFSDKVTINYDDFSYTLNI